MPHDATPVAAVLFDLDGVLVRSDTVWFDLINAARRSIGLNPITRDTFDATWGQGVDADAERFVPAFTEAQLGDFYAAHFVEHGAGLEREPGARELLAELRRRGVPHAVVTNTPTELARQVVDLAGLAADIVVGSTDVTHSKPAPDMLLFACTQLGVAPRGCLMVGDSRFDRQAAAAAKIRFVGYRTGGDHRIEALGELLGLLDARARA